MMKKEKKKKGLCLLVEPSLIPDYDCRLVIYRSNQDPISRYSSLFAICFAFFSYPWNLGPRLGVCGVGDWDVRNCAYLNATILTCQLATSPDVLVCPILGGHDLCAIIHQSTCTGSGWLAPISAKEKKSICQQDVGSFCRRVRTLRLISSLPLSLSTRMFLPSFAASWLATGILRDREKLSTPF